jgi:CRISPR-associated protein Cmr4
MTTQIKNWYKITALTNLHVGSGDQNYGIIDKLVQRDPLSQFPVIHASSVKGALKEYCEASDGIEKVDIQKAFGDEENPGTEKFFSAHLLTLPVRSSVKPYLKATCPFILKEVIEMLKVFNKSIGSKLYDGLKELSNQTFDEGINFILFDESVKDCIIEEYPIEDGNFTIEKDLFTAEIKAFFDCTSKDFLLIRDDIFMEICENLPVVARNRIGKKKNLWYEELVPRQSEFYFFYVGTEEGSTKIMDKISGKSKTGLPVQIGANATVGYGYCKIDQILMS